MYKRQENGWTVRQVVHHCADSHLNSILRFKLALTEEKPTIKPYFEDRFAELIDSKNFPIEASLQILDGTHKRWTAILKSLSDEDLQKTFIPVSYTHLDVYKRQLETISAIFHLHKFPYDKD